MVQEFATALKFGVAVFSIKIFFCLVQLVLPNKKVGCGTATLCILLWVAWAITLSVYVLSVSGLSFVYNDCAVLNPTTDLVYKSIGVNVFILTIASLAFIPIMCICCGIYACCMLLCNSV